MLNIHKAEVLNASDCDRRFGHFEVFANSPEANGYRWLGWNGRVYNAAEMREGILNYSDIKISDLMD